MLQTCQLPHEPYIYNTFVAQARAELPLGWQAATRGEPFDGYKQSAHTHPVNTQATIIVGLAMREWALTCINKHRCCQSSNNGDDGEMHYVREIRQGEF